MSAISMLQFSDGLFSPFLPHYKDLNVQFNSIVQVVICTCKGTQIFTRLTESADFCWQLLNKFK